MRVKDAGARLLGVLLGLALVSACVAVPAEPSARSSADPEQRQPVVIDTDVAADDLVAIAFLVASPRVEVLAITVSGTGEAHCEAGVDIVLRLLERLGAPAIEVACGRETPMAGDHAFPDAWRTRVDGGSGLALPETSRRPAAGDAVQLLSDTAAGVEDLRVVTLGPLTNLADAVARDPEVVGRLESVYAMGGALFVPGNVSFGGPPDNEVAEWNIYVDPTAAQLVVDAGVPVRLVSLDGTNQAPVTTAFAERVRREATSAGARVLAELFDRNPFMTDGTYYLWDPLAAALAADEAVGSFRPARIDVEEAAGPEVGFTRPVEGSANVDYLTSADVAVAERVLLETLQGGSSE